MEILKKKNPKTTTTYEETKTIKEKQNKEMKQAEKNSAKQMYWPITKKQSEWEGS